MAEEWDQTREIHALAYIAQHERIAFALRGSAASVVVEAFFKHTFPETLFESMPPFSDLDFLVNTPGDARQLEGFLTARLPQSRFFRIDILTPDQLARYRGSNIVVEDVPRVVFGEAPRQPIDLVFSLGDNDEIRLVQAPKNTPSIRRGGPGLDVSDLLIDVAWIARRHPQFLASKELLALRQVLEKNAPTITQHIRGARERKLIFGLAKLLLSRATVATANFSSWLTDRVWSEMEKHPNAILADCVRLLREGSQDVVVTGVPRLHGTWRTIVERVGRIDMSAEREIALRREGESGRLLARIPPVRITTDEPERSGCCRYRDFGRGTIEIGWAGPTVGSGVPPPNDLPFTPVASGDDLFLAPSLRSRRGGENATRIDYGFICQLTGRAQAIDIHPAGADDAE